MTWFFALMLSWSMSIGGNEEVSTKLADEAVVGDQLTQRIATRERVADAVDDGASFAIAEGLRGNKK